GLRRPYAALFRSGRGWVVWLGFVLSGRSLDPRPPGPNAPKRPNPNRDRQGAARPRAHPSSSQARALHPFLTHPARTPSPRSGTARATPSRALQGPQQPPGFLPEREILITHPDRRRPESPRPLLSRREGLSVVPTFQKADHAQARAAHTWIRVRFHQQNHALGLRLPP